MNSKLNMKRNVLNMKIYKLLTKIQERLSGEENIHPTWCVSWSLSKKLLGQWAVSLVLLHCGILGNIMDSVHPKTMRKISPFWNLDPSKIDEERSHRFGTDWSWLSGDDHNLLEKWIHGLLSLKTDGVSRYRGRKTFTRHGVYSVIPRRMKILGDQLNSQYCYSDGGIDSESLLIRGYL